MLWLDPAQTQLLDEDEDLFGRPWPTYSLQNMPKTQFTCRDKILGGYYADPETQCQMFHVCVKLPGIGLSHRRANSFVQQVQDYRFLCPNSTAFDQELQICANWADVDCDKATAYYDNNNLNDLYRGGDESKAAHEEEATFHLQRAESADVRRHKEQQQQQQPKTRSRHNYANANSNANSNLNADSTPASKRPISSYYTPTTSSSSSTTTTSTERSYYNNHNYNNNNNDDSKQDIDDIFKGSHSSHFFANRHGGREFDEEPAQRVRPNDVNDYTRKTTEAVGKTRATPTRAQTTASTTTTTTTAAPTTKALKKITLHAAYNTDFQDFTSHYRSTTPSSVTPTAATTPRLGSGITSRFSFGQSDYQTQERIQPTTYNPNASGFRKSTVSSATKLSGKNAQDFDKETTRRSKTTVITTRKLKLGPQESNYVNHNEFVELPRHKLQQPQPFQAQRKPAQLEPQYQRPKAPAQPLTRVGNQEPTPFKAATSARPRVISNRGSITYKATTQRYVDDEIHYPTTTTSSAVSPSAAVAVKKLSTHAARDAFTPTTFKPTTYKKSYEQSFYQTQQTQRPSQAAVQSISKKTSPVTASLPTTANPYYNVDEDDGQYHPELYENDFPRNRFKFLRNRSSSSTTSSTTSAPVSSRQPHGFQQAHSHLRSQQQSAYQKEQSDLSDEDELFKTAQSLNFGAASINKLRADIYKAEKTSQQYNSQYSPQAAAPSSPKTTSSSSSSSSSSTTTTTIASTTRRPTTSTTTTTTTTTTSSPVEKKTGKSKKEQQKEKKSKSNGKRPAHADEDTSYDYAYYDTD